jgi:magnesium transporter
MTGTAVQVLARGLVERFPGEAALELEAAPDDEAVALLGGLPPAAAAPVLDSMTPVGAVRVLVRLSPQVAGALLEALDQARAAALVSRLDLDARAAILERMRPSAAKEIAALAEYPEDSAGSLMDPQVMAFHRGMTVGAVLEQLRELPHKRASEVFLVREDGTLVGAVPLQDLAVAGPDQRMEELLGPHPMQVQAMSSRNEVVEALAQADAGLVVVDMEQRLLGVIRRDALLQAAQEVASADAQAMVGASKEERALSRPLFAVRKRLPWLVINLVTAFLAAAVVGIFESTIAKFTALAVLLPVVAGQSGNTGAQALAVTMRGLALREVRTRHALAVCFKELQSAFINGVAIAVITASAVLLWSRSVGLMLVIGVSMVLSMMAAGFAGAVIPMLLTVFRQDPAQSSSIVLTTVTDVVGFLSFLGIATLFASMI